MSSGMTPVPGLAPSPTTANIDFLLGTQIGVGEGLNSEVYLAHDQQLDTQLVIKKVPKSKLSATSDYFSEARRLYDARHKHVVEVKYACQDADFIYFAMPFYRGGSLQALIDQRLLTTREIVRYGLEFLAGLHHVHVKGLVHLDVKPTNVLLDDSDTAALTDFGLSREVTAAGVADMPFVYMPHVPPERIASTMVAKSADVYQSGLTLYRMCVGNDEFDRQLSQFTTRDTLVQAIQSARFPDRTRHLPHIPVRLRNIVKKALAVDPAARYHTVLEFMNAAAQVNDSLDWSYQPGATWGEGQWYESDGSRGRRVEAGLSGASWLVSSTRVSAAGREARFAKYCKSGLTQKQATALVEEALTEPWR